MDDIIATIIDYFPLIAIAIGGYYLVEMKGSWKYAGYALWIFGGSMLIHDYNLKRNSS